MNRASEILRKFDEEFSSIIKQTVTIKTEVFDSKNAADLQEKLDKIIAATNSASKERYLSSNDHEAILARLIMQVYSAVDNKEKVDDEVFQKSESFFEILTNSREVELERVFSDFDFYQDNPYREIAERRLAKLQKKRDRAQR